MLYDAERGDMTIAVVGDAMISRRMRAFRELHFLKLVEIIRNADVSIANLEFLFHDYESSWQWTRGTYTRSDPKNLNELKWMGFDAVLTANNHAYDFSEGGFLTTLRHLEEVDLPHAGGGPDLDHSRAPAYIDSPRGRVAVMSASSTFTDVSRAGPGRPDFPGRPGINALRHDLVHHVTQDVFEALHKANRELGLEAHEEAQAQFGFSGHTNSWTNAPLCGSWSVSSVWPRRSRSRPPSTKTISTALATGYAGPRSRRTGWCTVSIATKAGPPESFTVAPEPRRLTSWCSLRTGPSIRAAICSLGTARTSCAALKFTRAGPFSTAWGILFSRMRPWPGSPMKAISALASAPSTPWRLSRGPL